MSNYITKEQIEKLKQFLDQDPVTVYDEENDLLDNDWDYISDNIDCIDFQGTAIFNPWYDTAMFNKLSDEQAVKYYGLDNIINFINNNIHLVK